MRPSQYDNRPLMMVVATILLLSWFVGYVGPVPAQQPKNKDRIEKLEEQITQLEARIKKLEQQTHREVDKAPSEAVFYPRDWEMLIEGEKQQAIKRDPSIVVDNAWGVMKYFPKAGKVQWLGTVVTSQQGEVKERAIKKFGIQPNESFKYLPMYNYHVKHYDITTHLGTDDDTTILGNGSYRPGFKSFHDMTIEEANQVFATSDSGSLVGGVKCEKD